MTDNAKLIERTDDYLRRFDTEIVICPSGLLTDLRAALAAEGEPIIIPKEGIRIDLENSYAHPLKMSFDDNGDDDTPPPPAPDVAELVAQLTDIVAVLKLSDCDGVRAKHFQAAGVHEDSEVKALCERVGYGAVMDSAARQWFLKDEIGAFVVGACALTVRNSIKRADNALAKFKEPRS